MGSTIDTNPAVRRVPTGSPFFRSKLRAPVPPEHHVHRPRLVELLDVLTKDPATLVVAPAGAGKTSLVAEWAAQTPVRTSWLSLDDADKEGGQLWKGVVAAIEEHRPGVGAASTALLRRHHDTVDVVHALLAGLEDGPHDPLVVVIDGVDRVDDDPDATRALDVLVEHLPRWLHVVLISRRTPPGLPVERLQASGRLAEVGFAQLRFSHDESVTMLSRLTPTMSPAAVERAARQADGWAAALQLAGLAARVVHAQPELAPDDAEQDRLIDDYLWREVFDGERADVLSVLLDTGVVERVNPSLAEALTDRPDAHRLLVEAESRGLFVRRLDAAGWFEVHSLVRSMLIVELARRVPERVAEQHARAARWLEEAGELVPALDHWIAAGRHPEALALLAASTEQLYDEGREATILRVLGQIPAQVATADLGSLVQLAWCRLLVSRDDFLDAVAQATALASGADVDPVVAARLTVLRSIASLMTGDWDRCRDQAQAALTELGDAGRGDPVARLAWNQVARGIALAEQWDDAADDVQEARVSVGRDPDRWIAFEATRAIGLALAGRPVDALRVSAGVRRTADVGNRTLLRAELAVAEALAHRELGDRERAEAELVRLAAEPVGPATHVQVLASLALVEGALGAGDVATATRRFEHAEALVGDGFHGTGGRDWLGRVGTRLALARDDLRWARGWAGGVADPFWGPLSVARVRLAEGDLDGATEAADRAVPRSARQEVVGGLLRARTRTSGEAPAKLVALAVETAWDAGLLQSVADEGEDVVELVERAAWHAPQEWLDRLRRAAVPGRPAPAGPGLVDVLTGRELDVLRLLPSRLTLREIASELFVSPNTLKFHLRVIYRKLGVNSRAGAVDVARNMRGAARDGQPGTTFSR